MSHRFNNLVLRIVHYRLLQAASLKDHKLILECYHPSSKYTEPYLFCDYLGTPGLGDHSARLGTMHESDDGIGHLDKFGSLYSRFRPTRPDTDRTIRRPHPAGDVPGHPGSSSLYPERPSSSHDTTTDVVTHTVSLDSYEPFSQLCAVANLVRPGPRRGVFSSCVNVVEGVVRIWRQWLAESAHLAEHATADVSSPAYEENASECRSRRCESARIIWVDKAENVGIQVRVRERKWRRDLPILQLKEEDLAVSYSIEYDGMLASSTPPLLRSCAVESRCIACVH